MPAQDIITKVEIWPVDVPITDPFVVATGRLVTAQNLFVRITLKSGARGYGEIAPFPEVGGDDRPTCLQIATQLAATRSEEHTSELQSHSDLVCRLLLEKKNIDRKPLYRSVN